MSTILHGLGVSPGIAVGRVYLIEPDSRPLFPTAVVEADLQGEEARLLRARDAAREELRGLKDKVRAALGEPHAAVLEAQLLILDDPALVPVAVRRVHAEKVGAAWALAQVFRGFSRKFEMVDDGYFRERGGDLADVHARLQRLLREPSPTSRSVPEGPLVVVAHSVGASDLVSLAREGVVGLVTDVGGPTSHTAILAQALSLPAVVGLHDVSRLARPGDTIVVDANAGVVELTPSDGSVARAARRRSAWIAEESNRVSGGDLPAETRDGVRVILRANIELPEQVEDAMRYGARGIGLYRSEFLFLTSDPGRPTEEEQFQIYREMAARAAPHPTVIRTLDLGEETRSTGRPGAPSPLGLRAVRLCLDRPDVFLPQLRALLRAAAHGDVRVLLPFVTGLEEIVEVRRLLAAEVEGLRRAGVAHRPDPPLGIMIEVPAAAAIADILAVESDFFSIGTNDLIQYSLAVDRGDEAVAARYEPLHPAVLRMLDGVIRAGAARGLEVSLCGEMAADPALAELLVGLGLREMSMDPRAVPGVRRAVRNLDAAASEQTVKQALSKASAREVAAVLSERRGVRPPLER